jgi:WD40 repeat protein
MENEKGFICEFKDCKLILEYPVTLPCGFTLCREHLIKVDDKFKCWFCGLEHFVPENGFAINQAFTKMMRNCLDKNSLHQQTKLKFDELHLLIEEYEKIKPDLYIYDYFADIIRKVDLHREELIKDINEKYDDIIQRLKTKENNCKINSLKLEKSGLTNHDLTLWKNQLRIPAINLDILNDIMSKITNNIEIVRNEIRTYKNELTLNESIQFVKFEKSTDFGKLIENKIKLNLSKNCGTLIKSYSGHCNLISSIKLIEDANKLITGSHDSTIKIWNLETGECYKTLNEHNGWVTSVILSENNQLISSSVDQSIKIWDLDSYKCKITLNNDAAICSMCLISNNKLAVGLIDGTINIWNVNDYTNIKSFKAHSDYIPCLKLIKNLNRLISVSFDKSNKIWDLETFECIKELDGHSDVIWCLEFTSDGNMLSGSTDKSIKLWNLEGDGSCLKTLNFESNIFCIKQISQDIIVIGTSNLNDNLIVYDLKNNIEIMKYSAHHKSVTQAELDSNGHLFTTSGDGKIKQWKLLD